MVQSKRVGNQVSQPAAYYNHTVVAVCLSANIVFYATISTSQKSDAW